MLAFGITGMGDFERDTKRSLGQLIVQPAASKEQRSDKGIHRLNIIKESAEFFKEKTPRVSMPFPVISTRFFGFWEWFCSREDFLRHFLTAEAAMIALIRILW